MDMSTRPLALEPTRVWRTYTGGRMLDTIYGLTKPADGELPESWIASVVEARNAGREEPSGEGLSVVRSAGDEPGPPLRALIEDNPAAFLGKEHCERFGTSMALLVKLIDSAERLTIQVHPTRPDSERFFHSPFGKSEFWVILGGREIDGEPPYVLFGFKPGISREKWERLFRNQDIPGMIDCLHKLPVKEGDTVAVPGGMPHAIGPGCFLLEAQEPTDFTLRPERVTPKGRVLSDESCHMGVGFDAMLAMFDYSGYTPEELRERFIGSCRLNDDEPSTADLTAKTPQMPFSVIYHSVRGKGALSSSKGFSVVLCLEGEGRVGGVPLSAYGSLFVPASALERGIEVSGKGSFRLLECLPER
jgi:mannose-6-phosphate isomerase